MAESDKLIVRGAREHNLKNIDVEMPRNKLVVISGLSGSGKSSLAFDTIFAEGQRRYMESLSSYARQFLGRMDKPDIDYSTITPDMVVSDVVFNPVDPLFLQEARKQGAKTVSGIGMLVQQGALAFTLWTGKEAPEQVMYDTLAKEFAE